MDVCPTEEACHVHPVARAGGGGMAGLEIRQVPICRHRKGFWLEVDDLNERYSVLAMGIICLTSVGCFVRMAREPPPLLDTEGRNVRLVKTITNDGGRVAWSPTGDLIAFDRPGEDGYYDVWLMNPDGSGERCLTCSHPALPQKHNGQPAWHPSGRYIVFQCQDPELGGARRLLRRLEKVLTGPGGGVNNNLWLTGVNTGQVWQLTHIPDKMATLHSHFSHDGTKLVWSERVGHQPKPLGQWAIEIADFVLEGDEPHLANTQEYRPGKMQFYETHGYSPDDQKIIFSATKDGDYSHLDIYTLDLSTETLELLTDPGLEQWDEHAHFSPGGATIVWMSSRDIPQTISQYEVIADYWIMHADGSNKRRLTFFNDPTGPEYVPDGVTVADFSWSPDGKTLAAYLINRRARRGSIVLIELDGAE